jgi:cyclophilin family peptidyl-prolyl cis-trans isomerase
MTALTLLVAAQMTPHWVAPYAPHGPKLKVTMKTGRSFVIETDPKGSPKTVAQIIKLVRSGFYNRQRVHRVESWVIQWGDPVSRKGMDVKGVGDGGSGVPLPFEMRPDVDFTRGVVGIASEGLQLGGDSQLFILKTDRLYLYESYAVVGRVVQGMEVVGSIEKGDQIRSIVVMAQHRRR